MHSRKWEQEELAGKLRRLRFAKRLSTRALAAHTGLSQSKIVRFENAQSAPTVTEATVLARWLTDRDASATRLIEAAERLGARQRRARVSVLPDQATTFDMERDARTVRLLAWHFMPGLLQTPEYALQTREIYTKPRSLSTSVLDAAWLETRLKRQACTYSAKRTYVIIMNEELLLRPAVDPEVHMRQLEAILRRMELPGIELGVFPMHSPLPSIPRTVLTLDGFGAVIEEPENDQFIEDVVLVAEEREQLDAFASRSLWGADALSCVTDAQERLTRSLGSTTRRD